MIHSVFIDPKQPINPREIRVDSKLLREPIVINFYRVAHFHSLQMFGHEIVIGVQQRLEVY